MRADLLLLLFSCTFLASIAQALPREQKDQQGQASDDGDHVHDFRRRELHRGRVRFQVGRAGVGRKKERKEGRKERIIPGMT